MALSPYNITISSQCATIVYQPYREGLISGGWNVTYSGNDDSSYNLQTIGIGASSRRTTLAGATFQIDWVGTAIYLYGSAPSGSFSVSLDGGNSVTGSPDTSQGLLNSLTGLQYGNHTVVLTVVGGNEVNFGGAVLTVGVGYQGRVVSMHIFPHIIDTRLSATIKNSTQFAAINNGTVLVGNPFFTFSPNWGISDPTSSQYSLIAVVCNG
jgi:hypothetical protein